MTEHASCPLCGQSIGTLEQDAIVFHGKRAFFTMNGETVRLKPHETMIFTALYRARPRVMNKWAIYDLIYGLLPEGDQPDVNIINVHVCHLRRRLKPFGFEIKNSWGEGYSLIVPANAPKVQSVASIDDAEDSGGADAA